MLVVFSVVKNILNHSWCQEYCDICTMIWRVDTWCIYCTVLCRLCY